MKKLLSILIVLFSIIACAQTNSYSIASWGLKPQPNTQIFDLFCHMGFTGGTTYIDQFQLSVVYDSQSVIPPWLRLEIYRVSQLDSNVADALTWSQTNGHSWAIDSSSPPFQSFPMEWSIFIESGQPVGTRSGLAAYDIRAGDSLKPIDLWDSSKPPIVLHGSSDGICVSFGTEVVQNVFYVSLTERFHETIP